MTLPIALLDTDTLIDQLRSIEGRVTRPKPKARSLPAYVPDVQAMFVMGGVAGDPDDPEALRMVGSMIAGELWKRGALSISAPDAASVLREADHLLKGHQP